jgi:hypothetical protein
VEEVEVGDELELDGAVVDDGIGTVVVGVGVELEVELEELDDELEVELELEGELEVELNNELDIELEELDDELDVELGDELELGDALVDDGIGTAVVGAGVEPGQISKKSLQQSPKPIQ